MLTLSENQGMLEEMFVAGESPRWARTWFYDREKDEIYLPSMSRAWVLAAVADGVPMAPVYGEVYLPSSWLIDNVPAEFAETYRYGVSQIRKAMAQGGLK